MDKIDMMNKALLLKREVVETCPSPDPKKPCPMSCKYRKIQAELGNYYCECTYMRVVDIQDQRQTNARPTPDQDNASKAELLKREVENELDDMAHIASRGCNRSCADCNKCDEYVICKRLYEAGYHKTKEVEQ